MFERILELFHFKTSLFLLSLGDVNLHVQERLLYWENLTSRIEETLNLQGMMSREEWDETVVSSASEIKQELIILVNKVTEYISISNLVY